MVRAGRLKRILAQVEVSYSNSVIESWWRSLKHGWLFLNTLDSVAALERLITDLEGHLMGRDEALQGFDLAYEQQARKAGRNHRAIPNRQPEGAVQLFVRERQERGISLILLNELTQAEPLCRVEIRRYSPGHGLTTQVLHAELPESDRHIVRQHRDILGRAVVFQSSPKVDPRRGRDDLRSLRNSDPGNTVLVHFDRFHRHANSGDGTICDKGNEPIGRIVLPVKAPLPRIG